jgi:hypothetical protein
MADDPIPGDLREFILGHIDSIAQLEALLLLRRNPSTTWNPSCVAERLYVTEGEATDLLTRLNDDGFLIVKEGSYHFGPKSAKQREMADRVADAYSQHFIPITNIIHGKPRRIREFSDAFKFRRNRS